MRKLKVLQLCHDYEGPFVSVCSMYLNAFDKDKHEVTTAFLRGKKSKYVEESMAGTGVVFFELPQGSLRGFKFRAIGRVLALCRQERFDLVIAHRYKPIFVAGMVSLFTPFKLLLGVAHEHDVFTRKRRQLFLRFWCPNLKIVGVSDSVRSDILRSCPTLDDRSRVYSLPNCIDLTMKQQILERQDARRALGMDAFSYTFGTIGRLVQKKQHEILLKALTHQKLQQCHVVIIGSGSRQDSLEQLAEHLGVGDRVIFAGHIHQAFKYVAAFDAFVLSSGEKEAFGVVLLEAMMAKIPIICSDAKGPHEVVGDTGLLFKQGDVDDLSARMIELRSANEEEVSQHVEKAYDRLVSDFHSGCFKQRFWDLPPVQQIDTGKPDSFAMELLSTLYRYKVLPKIIRHSIYRKLRRRGVTPSEEFETDFFGLQYKGDVRNEIDADVYFYGGFEKTMLFFLRDFLAVAPGTFVDIGANVGNHSLFMSRYAEHVHSFEPFPPVLEKMMSQIKTNKLENITIHKVALGDEAGIIPFYAPPEESMGGGSFLKSVASKHGQRPVVDLPVVSGDDYFACQGINMFSAIKIDVEGYEIPVLKGLSATLNRVRPLVIMEVTHGASEVIATTTDIQDYLPGDYVLFRFENRDDRLFRNQSRSRKRSGRYRLYPVSRNVRKKRADVVACPREWLDKMPRTNRKVKAL